MNLPDFYKKHEALLSKTYILGKLHLTPQTFDVPNKLEEFIADWKPLQGWASRQSEVQVLLSGVNGLDQKAGHIIAAEFANGELSLHIRQKNGGWVATETNESSGRDVLVEQLTFVGDKWLTGKNTGLHYSRYWILDDTDCPKQFFAAFKGFISLETGAAI